MGKKIFGTLFLTVVCFIPARAEFLVHMLSVASANMGYKPGLGFDAEYRHTLNNPGIMLIASGQVSYEPKIGAEKGYVYSGGVILRKILWDKAFVGIGYGGRGYQSWFKDERILTKHSHGASFILGAVFGNLHKIEVSTRYSPPETLTKNHRSSLILDLLFFFENSISFKLSTGITTYQQNGERHQGMPFILGFGFKM